jgi:hypothetical protein
MECTILEVLRGDRRFGPHSWLKMRIEPRGPEMFVPVFGDAASQYRVHQVVDVTITVTPIGSRANPDAPRPGGSPREAARPDSAR